MIYVTVYILSFLCGLIYLVMFILSGGLPQWLISYELPISCIICAGFGGVLYCIRGIYLNYSVKKNWSPEWHIWYFLRPVASLITGLVSFIFLKAGLLVLEAQAEASSSHLGYFALAFIAGLNVDKFINKVEELAQATWGIEKSRASKEN